MGSRFLKAGSESLFIFEPLLLGFVLLSFFGPNQLAKSVRRPLMVTPPSAIVHFHFGFNENLADAFWIRLIQDNHFCEKRPIKGEAGYIAGGLVPIDCEKGWVYYMLEAVTELAPKFRMPYLTGGVMLSVLVGDKEGARLIFEKALKRIPDDWAIPYRAAYHYLEEEKDYKRAAELFAMVGPLGGPWWTGTLAAKLQTDLGALEVAARVLGDLIEQQPEMANEPRVKQRLLELKKRVEEMKR
jgi:hypothetical protein